MNKAGTGSQKKPYIAGGGASKKPSDNTGISQNTPRRTDVSNDKSQTGNGENDNSVAVSGLPCHEYIAFGDSKKTNDNIGFVCQYTHNVSRNETQVADIDNGNLRPASCLPHRAGVAFYASATQNDDTGFCKITQIRTDISHDEAPVADIGNRNLAHVSLPCNASVAVGASERPSDNTSVCHNKQNGANVSCETSATDGDNGSSERMICLPDKDLVIAEYHSDAPETPVEGQLSYSNSAKEPSLTPSSVVVSGTLPPGEPPALLQPDESDVATDTKLIRYTS